MLKISPILKRFVRPSDHSTFSPSSGERWMTCPYSIGATKDIPEGPPSKYAAEGTEAHQVCEDYANHYFFEAEKTPALMMATDEQMESARGWVEVITSWLSGSRLGRVLYFGLETSLPIFPKDGCFGTGDALIVGEKGCVVLDFKNGVGHVVGARALQLQLYLLSVYNYVIDRPEGYEFNSVVYQPRVDPVPKEASFTELEMAELYDKTIAVIKAVKSGNVGEPVLGNHCYWCKARTARDPALKCPAQSRKQIELASENFDGYLKKINNPNAVDKTERDTALIKIIALLPLLRQVSKDAVEEFQVRLESGEKIDGLSLSSKLGNREWALDEAGIKAKIVEKYGFEPVVTPPPKLMGITEVEKKVGKRTSLTRLLTQISHSPIY